MTCVYVEPLRACFKFYAALKWPSKFVEAVMALLLSSGKHKIRNTVQPRSFPGTLTCYQAGEAHGIRNPL